MELQWGKSWSDTVSLTKTKRINKCHILTINSNNTHIYSVGLGVKPYQTGCIYIIFWGPLNNTTRITRSIECDLLPRNSISQVLAIIYSNYVNFTIGTNKA